ncbi:hypothetical protein VB776_05400 [Arcicella sp. DC2W]|uniref:Lipocalin-like domain-containing protein n=1 Tax=Arcicella gelida TaxID=2984195 RepID=A0ABU5S1I6_9BACT|nr:hypothetical protein [Arcicella sp. DC2W]MEA5402337.1 hypothetical protein [Arcicella sp. DC2W]
MRKSLFFIISVLCIGLMTSCDESITPLEKVVPSSVKSTSISTISVKQTLVNGFWQYSEINMLAGTKNKMLFSRQNNIGLSNTISKIQINFKPDGTITSLQQGLVVQKGKWKLLNNDKQLELAIESQPAELYDIITFNKDVIEYHAVLKQSNTDEATWSMNLAFLGVSSASVTEIVTVYKLSPI